MPLLSIAAITGASIETKVGLSLPSLTSEQSIWASTLYQWYDKFLYHDSTNDTDDSQQIDTWTISAWTVCANDDTNERFSSTTFTILFFSVKLYVFKCWEVMTFMSCVITIIVNRLRELANKAIVSCCQQFWSWWISIRWQRRFLIKLELSTWDLYICYLSLRGVTWRDANEQRGNRPTRQITGWEPKQGI